MDISKEYIRMCKSSVLWEQWNPQPGDFVYIKEKNKVITLGYDWICVRKMRRLGWPTVEFAYLSDDFSISKDTPVEGFVRVGHGRYYFSKFEEPIWLPRQDQIQELLPTISASCTVATVLDDFFRWLLEWRSWLYDFCDVAFSSFEKLWLIFYMYCLDEFLWNKYTKTWEKVIARGNQETRRYYKWRHIE